MKSTERITSILIALFEKEKPTVTDLTERYETTERTIQRDLATIREMLIEQRSAVTLHKDHRGRYYIQNPARIPIEEALALSKIVLSSRAFNKTELNQILTHLRSQLTAESQNILDRIIGSENIQYHELQHHLAPHDASILTRLNQFTHYVEEAQVLHFGYTRADEVHEEQDGLPVAISFNLFYFYVWLYTERKDRPYSIYRLDRFDNVKPLKRKITIPYRDRWDDGQFSVKSFQMFTGRDVTFRFEFWGPPEVPLDRLSHAKIIKPKAFPEDSVIIEASALDNGVMMWLLGEGASVKVLSPPSFVARFKAEIAKMQAHYQ
ncbi:helix-turn-helix transcriptional regulator [Latilactobacillus sakei]|uniref:helix-turn-helix transcriptional regulator n=1 Tax=Latilactobacillus sakei TaxID=1599 RepID=UPI000DC643E7|nr:WYL domain-containing protein [Latilactobacillus sakei]SPS03206.1 hypothetical protein LAS9624_00009 [Latilactobacillus sakei]